MTKKIQSKFEVGQPVVCIDATVSIFKVGVIYTITDVETKRGRICLGFSGEGAGWYASRFEPLEHKENTKEAYDYYSAITE